MADEQAADDHACTYFRAIDFNGDCVATYFDYVFEWLRFPLVHLQGGQGLLGDVERHLKIAVQCLEQFPLTDQNLVQSLLRGGISLAEFRANMNAKRNSTLMKTQISGLLRFLFSVSNEDGDETMLTKRELGTIYYVFRIDSSALSTAFDALDLDGDQNISFDEAVKAGNDYFITADDPRSAWFVGPVIKCEDACRKAPGCLDPIAEGTSNLPTEGPLNSLTLLLKALLKLPDQSCHTATIPLLEDLLPALLNNVTSLLTGVLGFLG